MNVHLRVQEGVGKNRIVRTVLIRSDYVALKDDQSLMGKVDSEYSQLLNTWLILS